MQRGGGNAVNKRKYVDGSKNVFTSGREEELLEDSDRQKVSGKEKNK